LLQVAAVHADQQQQALLSCGGLHCLQDLVHEHSMVKLLGQASSRAVQLMLSATNEEQIRPKLLKSFVQVQQLLPSFVRAWGLFMAGWSAAEAAPWKQLELQQLQKTGKERALAAAAPALLAQQYVHLL
jgi:hypothetical protein